MYDNFFGFREKPFKLVPNPEYLFLSKSHEIALAHLTYATEYGDGFVVITGEVGTGKTTLCRNYLEGLDEQTESAYIFHPQMESEQLLSSICREFAIPVRESSIKGLLDSLYQYLIEKNSAGQNVVLVLDEAQTLSVENLELIRMLSNLETTRNKLLQIILVGQPELEEKLESHELRQLAQRISLSYQLSPLSCSDTQAYIRHRLGIASQQRQADLFSPATSRMVFEFSRGVPRLINILCDRALLTAYSQNQKTISRSVMQTAIREMSKHDRSNTDPGKRRAMFITLGTCLVGLVILATVFPLGQRILYNWGSSEPERTGSPPQEVSMADEPPLEERDTSAGNVPTDIPESSIHTSALPGPKAAKAVPASEVQIAPEANIQPLFEEPREPRHKPDVSSEEPKDSLAFTQLIGRLDSLSSRQSSANTLLALWDRPQAKQANLGHISAAIEDEGFFQLAARQNGLRCYAIHDDWPLVQRLNLPVIVAVTPADSHQTVYLPLVGWREQRLLFSSDIHGSTMEVTADAIQPYLDGTVYIFWDNIIGYDMVIGVGADENAIFILKNLLQKIGYSHLRQTPVFNQETRQAVMDFQSRHQLDVDGLVGPLTKIMLLQQSGSVNIPTLSNPGKPPS